MLLVMLAETPSSEVIPIRAASFLGSCSAHSTDGFSWSQLTLAFALSPACHCLCFL